jgi:uncharacterized protein (TIGR04540 family)
MEHGAMKNIEELSAAVKDIIDRYFERLIDQNAECDQIGAILAVAGNRKRVLRGDDYAEVFKKILGKRRLAEFHSISGKIL